MTAAAGHHRQRLIDTYGYWGQCPQHPRSDWQEEVANGDTLLGYWEWVAERQTVEQ